MSKNNQEKIKVAVDLLIDKDTDLTTSFVKDARLRELTNLQWSLIEVTG